ncbi:MAG: DUF3857 and transglutaminase domain-containing protein [Bacteroidota bacterium]
MRIALTLLFLFISLFSFSQNFKYSDIPPELLKNANAVARLDAIDIAVEAVDKMTYSSRLVITVLNKEGDSRVSTRAFYDKGKKIKKIEAYVYDAEGSEIEHIKRKDFRDIAAVDGFSLYLDDRLLYYKYVPVKYPYTVEFICEFTSSDTGVVPQWYFTSGYGMSVQESRYSISYPSSDLKPVMVEKNLSGIVFDKQENTNQIIYSSNNIPALKRESLSPPFNTFCPMLSVRLPKFHYKGFNASVDNWKDMGLWIDKNLLSGRTELEGSTIIKAKSLVEGIDDDLEKAKIIYDYVQNNTRYISVQIGIGGFQPISAIEVDKVKYGDCKGLSNYTKALLEAVGVESYYVVVQAGSTKVDFDDDFADLLQGNHAIVAIPYKGKYYWIDCTSQVHPFGFIGDFTDDRKVLVVKPEGGEIIKTAAYLNEENLQRIQSNYQILEDGSIKGEVEIGTEGIQYDNRFYLETRSEEDLIKHYRNFWSNINGLDVKGYNFKNDKENVVFTEKVKIEATNYVSKTGNDLIVPINAFNNNGYVPNRYRNRKLPFRIQRGFLDEDECTIKLPEGYSVSELPSKVVKTTKFGSYEMELIKQTDDELLYKRKLLLLKGDYPKEEYNAYRSFRRTVAKIDNLKLILTNQTDE